MAAATRLMRSSIFPKRICGAAEAGDRGEESSIFCCRYSTAAPLGAAAIASTISGGRPNLTFSGMTSPSRTFPEPPVLRHALAFLHVPKPFSTQKLHDLFDQALWSRSARGQGDRLHTLKPF